LKIVRPYPPEFRRRALDLVESGRTVRDVAASLGLPSRACTGGGIAIW
jgi:transposase-like protein